MPPAITAWTSESGATAIAATWSIQASAATRKPIVHHRERNSPPRFAPGS